MKINWGLLLIDVIAVLSFTALGTFIGLLGGVTVDWIIYLVSSPQPFIFNITLKFAIAFGLMGLYEGIRTVIRDFL
jgi:hypothetical protein